MKAGFVCLVLSIVTAVTMLLLYLFAGIRAADLLAVGAGGLFLLWQVVLLTVPWGLFFQARQVVAELAVSQEQGLTVREEQSAEAEVIARRLLRIALGGHLVSAAVVAVVTFFSGHVVGYYFSGFYLLSTAFRPAQAYMTHLRGRLRTMLTEARFPRDDLTELRARVELDKSERDELRQQLHELEHRCEEQSQQLLGFQAEAVRRAELSESAVAERANRAEARATTRTDALEERFAARSDQLAQQVQALTRRFEGALDSYDDNQDLVTGLRAFLRMLRAEQI